MKIGFVTAFLLTVPPAAAQAQAPAQPAPAKPSILDMVANVPRPAALMVVGDAAPAKPALRDDPAVQGGKALRIVVPRKSANPWDVNVVSPLVKPVKAGSAMALVFWARLAKGDGGATSATLPNAAVQITAAPYTSLFSGPVTIGPEWKAHTIRGRADKDYPAGALAASIHLATGRQTIDFGPVFVADLGPEER